MLINLRNALMAGRRLPYDAEVEYLESSGTQWIDTGYAPTATTKLEIDLMFTGSKTQQFGSGRSASGVWAILFGYYQSKIAFWGGVTQLTRSSNYTTNELVTCGFSVPDQTYWIGGNAISDITIGTPTTTVQTFALFARKNADNTFASPCTMRVYSCKIWDNGVLVRDYIPVRKGTVGYLYDRVSGKLFGNAGTGDFTCGPDVVPVEYIESHAAEYIDTGAIPDDSTGIEVVHTICTDNEKDNIIFGARQDSGNTRYWSDIDWGANDSIGWGFNTYSGNNERFILTASDAGRIITNSLNFMNDRAGKIDGVTYDSSLQSKTLATINRSIYLFGANNMGTIAIRGTFKVYSAKISKGQTLVNKFLPVRVGSGSTWEGAMMDTLTRRIYRNAGTGAFSYGNDLKYPIPAS